MTISVSVRRAFNISFRYARNLAEQNPKWDAYTVADQAIHCAVQNGFDYEPFLKVNRAVLFAIYWTGKAANKSKKLPLWASEAHIGLEMNEIQSRSWYEMPANWLAAVDRGLA